MTQSIGGQPVNRGGPGSILVVVRFVVGNLPILTPLFPFHRSSMLVFNSFTIDANNLDDLQRRWIKHFIILPTETLILMRFVWAGQSKGPNAENENNLKGVSSMLITCKCETRLQSVKCLETADVMGQFGTRAGISSSPI
jgi:hypothetical protein